MSAQPIGEQLPRLRVVGGRDFDGRDRAEVTVIPLTTSAPQKFGTSSQRRPRGWASWGLTVSLALGLGAGLGIVMDSSPSAGVSVTVHTGDSLWQLAQQHTPAGGDPREVVADIIELNQLTSTTLQAGQVLVMPR